MKKRVKIFFEPVTKEFEIDDNFEGDDIKIDRELNRLILDTYRDEILKYVEIDYWREN